MANSRFQKVTGACALVALVVAQNAAAGPFTIKNISTTNDTETTVHIDGVAAEEFEIAYTDANGKARKTTVVTNGIGTRNVQVQAKTNTTITVTNLTQGGSSTVVASLFTPPSDIVVSAFTVDPRSELTFAGNTFALTGTFTTVDTMVDYDPASPTYGVEEGFVRDLSIEAIGSGGSVQFVLAGTPTYTLDLASVWGLEIPLGGLSIPRNMAFSGVLSYNSVSSPFDATFDGDVTFFADGSTGASGILALTTDFGPAAGTLAAAALPQIVALPEPATWLLLVPALTGLLSCRRRPQAHARSAH